MEGFARSVSGVALHNEGINPFGLILPARLRFGRGEALASVPEILAFGPRIVLVRGHASQRSRPLVEALVANGAEVKEVVCAGEPDLDALTAALTDLVSFGADSVLSVGGGSALDFGKALAALLPAPDPDPLEHLEVVGRGRPLGADPLPFIAAPTTAGTGSEATRNAVISVPDKKRKVSLRDPRMMARLAIVDPSLMDGAPPEVTLSCGLDAVTQVVEPYLSARATPFTDALCRDAISKGLAALAQLAQSESPSARDALAYVAYVSGVALANAGLGAVHGVAGVLGGETGAPHGQICGQLLAPVLRAYRSRAPEGSRVQRRVAEVDAMCLDALGCGIDGLSDWAHAQGLPRPKLALSGDIRRDVAEKSQNSSSMKPSPIPLTAEELATVMREAGW